MNELLRKYAQLIEAPSEIWRPGQPYTFKGPQISPIKPLFKRSGSAANLAVGRVDDPLEHEADRIADQVMRLSAPEVPIAATPPQNQRQLRQRREEAKTLQTKRAGAPEAATCEAPAIVHEMLRSPGQPLDEATRAFFEPRFGFNFGQVRVHADEQAARSARAMEAKAYTVGQSIVFGQGAFAPADEAGRRLLAHELVHVVQQSASGVLGARLQRQDEAGRPSKAEEEANTRLRRLAAQPGQALGQWKRLKAAERSFVVIVMTGRYGSDFAQEFLNYAQGRKKPDLTTEVTQETPASLTARGFRFAGDPGAVPLWVHPSGHEVRLLSRGKDAPAPLEGAPPDRPPEEVERCTHICEDSDDKESCLACCDERLPGASDDDIRCRRNCKEFCEEKL